jgi:hypothetical protein
MRGAGVPPWRLLRLPRTRRVVGPRRHTGRKSDEQCGRCAVRDQIETTLRWQAAHGRLAGPADHTADSSAHTRRRTQMDRAVTATARTNRDVRSFLDRGATKNVYSRSRTHWITTTSETTAIRTSPSSMATLTGSGCVDPQGTDRNRASNRRGRCGPQRQEQRQQERARTAGNSAFAGTCWPAGGLARTRGNSSPMRLTAKSGSTAHSVLKPSSITRTACVRKLVIRGCSTTYACTR